MGSNKEYFFTKDGLEKIKLELEELKGPERIALARRLRTAIQQGDLSENADYSKAKEDQAFLEGRIQEIEIMLGSAVIIEDNAKHSGVIGIGTNFTVKEEGRDEVEYYMVGAQEADPRNGKISNESPIGMALLDHRAGDKVEVETPAGIMVLEIIKVK
jgi:transcription elongation factor GreA